MPENKLPDFAHKLVLFYTTSAPMGIQDGVLMEFVSFTDFGGRLFLTGRIPSIDENSMDWASNLQAGLAWDDVVHYIVFESRDDYLSRTGTAKPSFIRRFFG